MIPIRSFFFNKLVKYRHTGIGSISASQIEEEISRRLDIAIRHNYSLFCRYWNMLNPNKSELMTKKANARHNLMKKILQNEFESKHFSHIYSNKGALGRVIMGNQDLGDEWIVSDYLDQLVTRLQMAVDINS